MTDMTTITTCDKCGDSYRESLVFKHECRNKHKGDVMERRELRSGMEGTCYRCFNDGRDAERQGLMAANFNAGFAVPNTPHTCEHTILVEQRDLLAQALRGYVTNRCRCYQGVQCHDCETKALLATVEQGGEA